MTDEFSDRPGDDPDRALTEDTIWSSEDPFDDVPSGLAKSLSDFVLVPDRETAWRRLDALRWLVELVLADDSPEPIPTGRPIGLQPDEHGRLRLASDAAYIAVPAVLVDQLTRDVLNQQDTLRSTRALAIDLIVARWNSLLVDEEKLLGHLLLAHGSEAPSFASADALDIIDALIRRHADLHSAHQSNH